MNRTVKFRHGMKPLRILVPPKIKLGRLHLEGFHGHEILVKAFSAFLHGRQQKFPWSMRKVGIPLNVTGLPKMTSQNLENRGQGSMFIQTL